MFALFAAGQVSAQSQTNATSASAPITVEKLKLHWLAPLRTTKTKENLKLVEGLDRRAWTTVVGWYQVKSDSPAAESHRSKLCLFWVDIERLPQTR